MVTSSINISSAGNSAINTTTSVSSGMPQISNQKIGVSMTISDTDGNQATASLNLNSSSLKLEILKSQEYQKQASLFFGSLFSGGFNAEYMWSLLAAPTNEQINGSHLTSVLADIHSDISSLADAFQLHYNNWNIHLSTEDRDFLTRLKGLYGGVYNVALDYLILVNPYEGEINLSENQIALFAGWGGFSAYSGVTDIELEFYNLLCIPHKSGGTPTAQAYLANDGSYGYGITTLNIPMSAPTDLLAGETALYVGEGGFNSVSNGNSDVEVIVGYYYEGEFYLEESCTTQAVYDGKIIYIDVFSNKVYRYDEENMCFIPLTADAGVVKGYFNSVDGNFYEDINGSTYTGLIEGNAGALYLDLTDNALYRYDEEEEEYIKLTAEGEGSFIIQGYRDSVTGLFYKDVSYTEAIQGEANYLYYDLLTYQLYYYSITNQAFDRYHHIIPLDYIILNTAYNGTISPANGQIAIFIGEGGFDAQSIGAGEEDEVVVGYYYDNAFYEEAAHTTAIAPNSESLFIDLATNTLYIYKQGNYIQASSAGGGDGESGTNTILGYIDNNVFYSTRTGNPGEYIYSNSLEPNTAALYIDRATGVFYKYIGSAYVAQTTQTILSQGYDLSISHNTSDLNQWIIEHSAFTNINYPSTSGADGDVVSGLSLDKHNSLYYGHITGISTTPFSKLAIANYIVQRTATDAAIKANYLVLTKNPTLSETLSSTETALFEGSGGFTATSYNGNNEYYPGVGLSYNSVQGTFNVRLSYQTSGNNYGVRTDDQNGGLYVYVPSSGSGGSSGGEGGSGTTDHNNLTNRFSTDFDPSNITAQHDIGVISGLQDALDTLTTNISKVGQNSWSASAPVVLTQTSTTNNNVTTYSNVISLESFSSITGTAENLSSGTLLSTVTSYAEHVEDQANSTYKRVLTKIPVSYNSSATGDTIAKRNNNGSLAASYLLLTNAYNSTVSAASGEAAVFIGAGGFTATSYAGNTEYFNGTGLLLNTTTNTFSVNLGYVSSGTNYGVRADSTGLYVNVPNSGGNGGQGGGGIGSIELTMPTGFTVTGSPLTANGTIAVTYTTGYSLPSDSSQSNWNTAFNNSHTHTNKSVLDGIDSTYISHWNSAYNEIHFADKDLNGYNLATQNWVNNKGFLTAHQSVTSNNNTASWGSSVVVGTVGGTDLKFKMPNQPTDNNTTYKLSVNGTTNGDSTNGVSLGTIYALTSAGTSGQFVMANSSGVPSWQTKSFLESGSRIGASNLPTGDSGTVLIGNGSSSNPSFSNSPSVTKITINGIELSKQTTSPSGLKIPANVISTGKFYDSSDIRLKRKIKELASVLDSLEDIPIVQYEYKAQEGIKYIGTLAQKLLPLFPELVNQDDEGYYSVDYGGLAAVAIQCIKELSGRVRQIERKVYGCD